MQAVNFHQDNLQSYQQKIAKIPRLTHEQVCYYARQVQLAEQLQTLRQDLHQQLNQAPTSAQWAQQAQLTEPDLRAALQAGQRAKRKLIEAHLRQVVAIARCYQNRGVDLLDLIQEGSVGLYRGVKKFNPTLGYRFSTYAYWWIRQAITQAIAENSKKRTIVRSEQTEILEKLESALPQPEEAATAIELQRLVNQMVSHLPPRERDVVSLIYGLVDGQPCTQIEVGEKLGLSKYQVHRSRLKALKTLKNDSALWLSLTQLLGP